ncbi:serine/threonine protein kinase [Naumannella sp. ID2617S]|nr:serine/threonine protein kinase [Naumannella sp. ID2617S]
MTPDLLANRYELTERLAGGGMGQVWRGRDRVLQRIVAVKTVDLAGQDQTARERFRREAVATAGLSAPQVVQVFDAGFDGDTAFLVMELLTGPSLSEHLHATGPLGLVEGLQVAREVTRGLLAAHRIGVVHRDIKPGNVMFHNNEVKLVDFGIAQLSENAGAALTAPATALGTAAYMSPEQASGRQATEAADWYALGCLLMTMFTGRPPFSGEALAVANQQINAQPPRLTERRTDLPPALDALVAALLAKDPAHRPSGAQVLDQLRALEADPGAPTMIAAAPTAALPTAVAPPATAVMPHNRTRTSYAETPSEPEPAPHEGHRRRPIAPVTAPTGSRPYVPPTRQKSRWPWVVVLLMLLAAGVAAAVSLLPNLASLPGGGVTATPTPTPSATRPTSTRPAAPTTTRATTRPPSTAPATSAAPPTTEAPTETPDDQPNGKGNQNGKGKDKTPDPDAG